MDPITISIAKFLTEFIAGKIIEDNILAKFKGSQIRREIADVIERTLNETISDFPDAQYIFDNLDIKAYLSDHVVQSELGKLCDLKDIAQPDNNVLEERWIKYLKGYFSGNPRVVVGTFLNRLRSNLWDIRELRELLHIRQQSEFYELLKTYLPVIGQSVREISSNLPSSSEIEKESDEVTVQKIETYRLMIRRGFPTAAMTQLGTLDEEIKERTISNSVRSKILTLIGVCKLELGDIDGAVEYFSRAYLLSPKDPDTIANNAVVCLIKENLDDAIRFSNDAIALKPHGTNAAGVKFEALARKRNFDQVNDLIDEQQLDDPDYVRVVGLLLSNLPDSSKAEKYLRLRLAQSPEDFYVGLALCKVLTDRAIYMYRHPITGFDIEEIHKIYDETSLLIDAIVARVQKSDNRYKYVQALASRSGIRALMGKFELAKTDCDTVLGENPEQPLALQNRAFIALIEKDYESSITHFTRLPDEILYEEMISISLARAYLGAHRPDDAIAFLERAKQRKLLEDYMSLEAGAYLQKGDIDAVLKLRENLLAGGSNYKALESIGIIDKQLHNYEEALMNLEKAYDLCPDENEKCFLAVEAAQINQDMRHYDDVVKWLERSHLDLSTDMVLARVYIEALYSLKDFEKAITFAKHIREGGQLDKYLAQIEGSIAEFLGDLPGALELSQQIMLLDPADLHYRMNSARLLFRLNRVEESISIMDTIDLKGLTAIELMMTAEMYSFVGSTDKAIGVGYQAYCNGKNSSEICRAYLALFLRLEKDLSLERTEVEHDTAILLEGANEQRWMKILVCVVPNEANWEYSPNSEQGKKLLGHKVGDLIVYRDSPLEKINFIILEIQSIYVRAFQEIFSEFGTRFPTDTSLQKIQIQGDDLTPFLSSVAKMGIFSDQVFDLYKAGVLSAEQFARMTGKSKIPTMRALQEIKDVKIVVSQGSYQEQSEQNELANGAIDISISIQALLTLLYLGLEGEVVRRFGKIYGHQRMLDEIDQALLGLKNEKETGRTTIGYHDGRFFMSETPEAVFANEVRNLEMMQAFVQNHCKLVALEPGFAQDLIDSEDIKNNPIGELSLISVLTALQTKTPLYNDDLVVSLYGKSKYGIHVFWTQPLLIDLLNKKTLDFPSYANLCCKLLEAGYQFTSINDQIILEIIEQDKYIASGRLDTVLLGLGQPTIESVAIDIGAKVIRSIWLRSTTPEQRRFVLDKVLLSLTTGRMLDLVLMQAVKKINRELSLAPLQLADVTNEIALWKKVHSHLRKPNLWLPGY